ncbi:MAG TPA: hypothetical protein VEA69_07480 [Tepidisphaeraceae bacterium]|nr:hypothetical protein [Tepidisphaeraceae bacterium]
MYRQLSPTDTGFNAGGFLGVGNGMSAASSTVTAPATNITAVSYIGVRTSGLEAGDTIWVDEFKVGTKLGDVAPVPLPVPAIAAAVLFGGTSLVRRRRKAMVG